MNEDRIIPRSPQCAISTALVPHFLGLWVYLYLHPIGLVKTYFDANFLVKLMH